MLTTHQNQLMDDLFYLYISFNTLFNTSTFEIITTKAIRKTLNQEINTIKIQETIKKNPVTIIGLNERPWLEAGNSTMNEPSCTPKNNVSRKTFLYDYLVNS